MKTLAERIKIVLDAAQELANLADIPVIEEMTRMKTKTEMGMAMCEGNESAMLYKSLRSFLEALLVVKQTSEKRRKAKEALEKLDTEDEVK